MTFTGPIAAAMLTANVIAVALVACAASLLWASVTPPSATGPLFVRVDANNWNIAYPPGLPASNYVWYVEYSCNVSGPYEWCPDCRYFGTNIFIGFRPNHFYRLRGITNY